MNSDHHRPLSRRRLLQRGAVVASGTFALPGTLDGVAQTQQSAEDGPGRTFTIANDGLERTLRFVPGRGLITEHFIAKASGTDFILPGQSRRAKTTEYSFKCNNHTFRGTDSNLELLGAENAPISGGSSLVIRLRHKALDLELRMVFRIYDGHAAVRKSLAFCNTGNTPLRISHLTMEDIGLSLGPENEMTLDAMYGSSPREMLYTGRSEDAVLLLTNSRTGIGVGIISDVPGYMKRTEIVGWYDPDRVKVSAMYDTDLMPFERTVAPGETFTSASVSLITFRRGDGFRDPRWVLPSYTSGVLMRRVQRQGPPWIYNTWVPFQRTVNRDLVLQLIDNAAAMGINIFTIDDGWQTEYGENTVDPKSFPGGLKDIQQTLESKGMRLGLWVPLAAIGKKTDAYVQHPEWAARDLDGQEKITGTAGGEKVVMCLASDFRDHAAQRVIDAITQFNLAYVKLDLTTIFNAYGEAPGCWAKGHHHATWSESLIGIYEGMAYVTRKVYEKHPDVLLDLTFELWGQKHVIDAGLLAAGDLDWLSNVDDTEPHSAGSIQVRQLLYQRSAGMPVESMLIGNMQAELPSKEERFATAIGSAPVLLGDLRKLSSADKAWYRQKIEWFRTLRHRTDLGQSFFPLGSWQQTSSTAWDGFARFSRSGNGVIALFRNHAVSESATVQLPVMPSGSYRLRSALTGRDLGRATQAELQRGINILFQPSAPVEVIEVTRA